MTKSKSKSASTTVPGPTTTTTAPTRRRAVRKPGQSGSMPSTPAKATKRDQLAALLVRDEGATLDQMIAATGWLPHTIRAALTGLKKRGYAIDSDKIEGVRTYRAVGPK